MNFNSDLVYPLVQGGGLVSNTFIFMDENAERIGIYSQRVLKPNLFPGLPTRGYESGLYNLLFILLEALRFFKVDNKDYKRNFF